MKADFPILTCAAIAGAALIVSAPATYKLVAMYHSDGTIVGIAATVALLTILEAGAVASKLATLWAREAQRWLNAFCVTALSINMLSNFIHGGHVATANGYSFWAAWAGSFLYAALSPALIYLMLVLIVHRVEVLRGTEVNAEAEARAVLQPLLRAGAVQRQAELMLSAPRSMPALPAQETYARPAHVSAAVSAAQPVAMPNSCPSCGENATPMQVRTAKQHGKWTCKGCGTKVVAK